MNKNTKTLVPSFFGAHQGGENGQVNPPLGYKHTAMERFKRLAHEAWGGGLSWNPPGKTRALPWELILLADLRQRV